MKKILSIMIATLGISSASMAQKLAVTPAGENPMSYTIEDKVLTVKLIGNSTTGYTWGHSVSAENILSVQKDEYGVPQNSDGKIIMGQPGVHTYIFEAVKPGKTIITFDYAQHWNNGNPGGIRKLKVKVNSELKISAKEKK